MLNFKTKTVLDIPERLTAQYRISPEFLNNVMKKYIIQTTNKDTMMKKWWIEKQPVLMASATKHYSWPKSAGEDWFLALLSLFNMGLTFVSNHRNRIGQLR